MSCLHALLASLSVLSDLLTSCAQSVRCLQEPDWTQEDRKIAVEADEFKGLLKGLEVLRRILWRLGRAAELFLPGANGDAVLAEAGDIPAKETKTLRELYMRTGSRLGEARSAWAAVDAGLSKLRIELSKWDPEQCFEAGGSSCQGQAGAERNSTAPLCTLCLLPAKPPFSLDGGADAGMASVLWKGSLWHVQCCNFWIRHGAGSKVLSDLGAADPFGS